MRLFEAVRAVKPRNAKLWIAVFVLALHPAIAHAANARLARILVGRSEAARVHQLSLLKDDVAKQLDVLDELIDAIKHHAKKANQVDLIPESMWTMINMVSQINRQQAHQCVIDLLRSDRKEIVILAATALGDHKVYDAIKPLIELTQSDHFADHYGFRFSISRALVKMEHPDAIEFLGKLSEELDGQLQFEIKNVLKEVSVDDFHGDSERFEAFMTPEDAKKKKQDSFFTGASYSESLQKIKLERREYYGIPIHAKRLLFVLDQSGSMKDAGYGGTRLMSAKRELLRVIDLLPPDSEFGILFFNSNVGGWREFLVKASEENKQAAAQFVKKIQAVGSTNTYGALRRCIDFDDQLEAVFVLTDGKPTAGQIVAPRAIVEDIMRRNAMRHLVFNTIGISVEGPTENFLKVIAERSNGEFRMTKM